MKKTNLGLILLVAFFLASCDDNNNSSRNHVSSSSFISESSSSSSSSSSQNSIEQDANTIYDLIETCITTPNYTLTLVDGDGTLTRKYTPAAYYATAPNDMDTIGYAKDEKGIFSFKYENNQIVPTSQYLKNSEEEVLKDLYTAKVYDSFEDAELNIIYSFALLELSNFADLADNYTTNGYTLSISSVLDLLPYLSQQQYQSAQVKVALNAQNNLEFKFNVSIGFSSTVYTLVVSDIGTTMIDLIEDYLESGSGALTDDSSSQTSDLKEQVRKLFASNNYAYMCEQTGLMGVMNEKFSAVCLQDMAMGYVDVTESINDYPEGLHSFMYNSDEGLIIDQNVDTENFQLVETYGFSGEFIDLFTFDSEENKLVTSDPLFVYGYSNRFDPTMETSIGAIELTYADEMITMVAHIYNVDFVSETLTDTGNTIEMTVMLFGQANAETLGETLPFLYELEGFLNQ